MRRSFVQIDGVLYEKGSEPQMVDAPMVMPDIQPYKSMIDGRMITSRSQHRAHLKDNGCVEVGNDSSLHAAPKGIPDVAPQQRKEIIRAQIDAMRHDDFKRMVSRDLDRIRWNSRGK